MRYCTLHIGDFTTIRPSLSQTELRIVDRAVEGSERALQRHAQGAHDENNRDRDASRNRAAFVLQEAGDTSTCVSELWPNLRRRERSAATLLAWG